MPEEQDVIKKEEQRKQHQQMTNEQLKKIAVQQSSKSKRATEVVKLPSKGLLYSEDSPLSQGVVEMFYPNAHDEDILMTASKIRRGTVIDDFIESIIATPIDYNSLIVGDRDKLIIAARILAYGPEFKAEIQDPSIPDEKQSETFNLNDLEEHEIEEDKVSKGENVFTFHLQRADVNVTFQLPTVGMNKKIEDELKRQKKFNKNVDRSLSTRLKHIIIDIDGETDRKSINDFVDSYLTTLDSKELRDYMYDISPGIDLKYTFTSDLTGASQEMEVPIDNPSFFWPSSRR